MKQSTLQMHDPAATLQACNAAELECFCLKSTTLTNLQVRSVTIKMILL